MVHFGYGAHLCSSVAASRAITEAAQARLTVIHGAREDIHTSIYEDHRVQTRVVAYFESLEPTASWKDQQDRSGASLDADHCLVLDSLNRTGHPDVLRIVLSRAPFNIPVAKVIVPSLTHNNRLF
jgi:ribosomal protein S12 methylthiotransferase accessory factor